MDLPVYLSKAQDARIASAVKKVEGAATDFAGGRTGNEPNQTKFPVMLTGEDTGTPGHYSWKMQKFSPSAGTWSDYSPSVDSGSLFTARELNGETGLQVNATTGPRVMLFFYGLDSAGKPIYLFERKGLDYFWAQITGSSLVSGEAARWLYTFAEVTGQWTTTGRGQLLSGGRTGSAYNSIEAFNPTSGIGAMGSGQTVTSTEFSNGLKLQPIISAGPAVKIYKDNNCLSGSGSGTGSGSGPSSTTLYLFEGWNQKKWCAS